VKPSVDPEATRQLLADIADAVRPVELARTAAAVERVLRTMAPGLYQPAVGGLVVAGVARELGVEMAGDSRCRFGCEACAGHRGVDLPGLVAEWALTNNELVEQRERYAPWNVSPHLFPEAQ
jgi:hypothetical protein